MEVNQMTNREIALVWMADVLGRLYDTWPGQVTLDPYVTIEETGVTPDGQFETIKLWTDLFTWLEREGMIHKIQRDLGDSAINDVVLTAKGFGLLGEPVPGTEKTVGSQLKDLAKEASTGAAAEAGKSAIGEVIGSVMGAFVKSMTSS
jgi:hypothetical protein